MESIEERMHRIDLFATAAMSGVLACGNYPWKGLPEDVYQLALAMEAERAKVLRQLKKDARL